MSNDNHLDLLKQEGFGNDSDIQLQSKSPISVNDAKQISVTIDEINFYTLNPRNADNPKYDEIKESIREIGLENPLTITKRPGESGYTLYNGGNTRLKALKELYQETGDDKFYFLDCRLMPWSSDSEIMIKHMIENETRGDMLLIDKAKAVQKIKTLYEADTGQTIGLRPLEQLLKSKGWKVSFVMVGVYIFCSEKLADKIPLALNAGLGAPKVKQIRKTYNAIEKYLKAKLPELNVEEIQALYLQNLAHYDSEDGVSDNYALTDTCRFIGEQSNIVGPRVQFEIDHILREGEIYSGGSLSDKWNDKGQPTGVGDHSGADTESAGQEQLKTETEGNEDPTAGTLTTAEQGETPITATEPVEKVATGSEPLTREAKIAEMGHQARNKVNMMLMKYEVLKSYMPPKNDFPFFEASDTQMVVLRIDLIENSGEWGNDMIALVCELVPFMTAYFEAKVEDLKARGVSKEIYQLDESALDICINDLREQVAISERAIDTIRYGFSFGDETVKDILAIQDDFYELGKLLRAYRWAAEGTDG